MLTLVRPASSLRPCWQRSATESNRVASRHRGGHLALIVSDLDAFGRHLDAMNAT